MCLHYVLLSHLSHAYVLAYIYISISSETVILLIRSSKNIKKKKDDPNKTEYFKRKRYLLDLKFRNVHQTNY